jgi:hypothetical protein
MGKTKSELYGDIESSAEQEMAGPVLDISGNQISKDWAQVFSGFVWGEGYFSVQPSSHGKSFVPRFAIAVRADDGWVIKDIAIRLGGSIGWDQQGDKNPKVVWTIASKEDSLRLIRVIELASSSLISFRKHKAFKIWEQAVVMYLQNPHGPRDLAVCHPQSLHHAFSLCRKCYETTSRDELTKMKLQIVNNHNQYLQAMSKYRKALMEMVPYNPVEAYYPKTTKGLMATRELIRVTI